MYFRPFLLIQILAFLTAQIWACLRLRNFGQEFMTKLQALAASGNIPIPLPHEMSEYLHIGSLAKTGTFFTFTLGFTLGLVALGGAFCLNRYGFSRIVRLGWTVFVSAFWSFFLGFSPAELLLFAAFFGLVHLAIRIPQAPFHRAALLSLIAVIPLLAIPVVDQGQAFLRVRDDLLQNPWGKKVVAFYYRYSPLAAEMITPPAERTQIAIWTVTPLGRADKSWLLKRRIYAVSTREGADLALPGDALTGPVVLKGIEEMTAGRNVKRLAKTIKYSIFFGAPLAIMLFFLLATDRLFALSKYYGIGLLLCLAVLSALIVYPILSQKVWESTGTIEGKKVKDVRRWALEAKETGDQRSRERFLRLLGSNNPAVRVWAATALAYLPSEDNVEPLTRTARRDPVAIVRCKAIFALSYQGDRGVIPFLDSRIKGEEDWYVKHYLLRALRRLGWIG